jgi:hypothetical protein
MNRAWASVVSIRAGRSGLSRALCRLDDGTEAEAVGYPELVGTIAEGDRVLLNTTAVDLALGSGGVHFIIARDSDPGESRESTGHIVKLRYTPHQMALLAVEEPASEFHSAIETADSLAGMPVVCCELVSQVPAVIAGLRSRGEPGRIALTVSDEAALPAQYSDLMMDLRSGGFVCSVITAGQAFGGDLEAVNVHSALLAARIACGAAFAIVTPGPGTVGTGTKWGFSGVRQGEAINAIAALEGRPIGVVRASGAEARGRHTGISHHTRTVFTRVATAPFSAAWPAGFASRYAEAWCSLCAETGPRISGYIVEGATEALQSFENDWRAWKTMGRGRSEDPLYYEAAAAAGILAMNLRREANCE